MNIFICAYTREMTLIYMMRMMMKLKIYIINQLACVYAVVVIFVIDGIYYLLVLICLLKKKKKKNI